MRPLYQMLHAATAVRTVEHLPTCNKRKETVPTNCARKQHCTVVQTRIRGLSGLLAPRRFAVDARDSQYWLTISKPSAFCLHNKAIARQHEPQQRRSCPCVSSQWTAYHRFKLGQALQVPQSRASRPMLTNGTYIQVRVGPPSIAHDRSATIVVGFTFRVGGATVW